MGDFIITLPSAKTIRFTGSILDATPASLLRKLLLYPLSFIPAFQRALEGLVQTGGSLGTALLFDNITYTQYTTEGQCKPTFLDGVM
jgi:hypothetical protein